MRAGLQLCLCRLRFGRGTSDHSGSAPGSRVVAVHCSAPHLMGTPRSGDIVLAPGHAEAALQVLLAEVDRKVPRHLGLNLRAVRQSSPVWSALQNGAEGHVVRRGRVSTYSFLDVHGDFESYLDGFGNMGRNLKRFRKKLEGLGHVSVEIRKGSTGGEDLLREFLALEASGWKSRKGTAILSNPDVTDFYTALGTATSPHASIWNRHTIRLDKRLVAAQLAVRCSTSLVLLKYAFDEDFADCRPGTLLTEVTFREGFSRPEIDEINPMSDFDAHRIWHMAYNEYVDVQLIRPKVSPSSASASALRVSGARAPSDSCDGEVGLPQAKGGLSQSEAQGGSQASPGSRSRPAPPQGLAANLLPVIASTDTPGIADTWTQVVLPRLPEQLKEPTGLREACWRKTRGGRLQLENVTAPNKNSRRP